MAAKRIPQLDPVSAANVDNGDSLVLFDAGADATKRVLRSNLLANNSGASVVGYTQGASGASDRTVQDKLRESVSVKDFGAVGDGVTDDTAAIQAALDYAASDASKIVYGVAGDNYRTTSTLSFYQVRFDGRFCTITKDFAGIGATVTGGAFYSRLYNFTLNASASYSATDYDASTQHDGIQIVGTRVEMYDVSSNNHVGNGFLALQNTGNMNKCKFIRISAGGNAQSGFFMNGNYPTTDDMSVWEFNGRFQSNYGYGVYATTDCGLRNIDAWIYAESNFVGASAPTGQPAVHFNYLVGSRIWAYVEQQAVGSELGLGANATANVVQSVRRNDDSDFGTNNTWLGGSIYTPSSNSVREVTTTGFRGDLARVANSGEYVRVPLIGSGGVFGYIKGEGNTSGEQTIGLANQDDTTSITLNNERALLSVPSVRRMNAGTGIVEIELESTAPTSNQVTLTVDFTDSVSKHGSGLLEIFLCADTDSTPLDAIYFGYIPVSVRNGTSSLTAYTKIDTKATNITVASGSPSISGTTMTVVFDCNAAIIAVVGHVTMRGGAAYITGAALS